MGYVLKELGVNGRWLGSAAVCIGWWVQLGLMWPLEGVCLLDFIFRPVSFMYCPVQCVNHESPERHQAGLLGTKIQVQQIIESSPHDGSDSE